MGAVVTPLLLLLAYQASLLQSLRWAHAEQVACLRISLDLTARYKREADQWRLLAELPSLTLDEVLDGTDEAPRMRTH